jgi:virulence-associated protein VagC
MHTSIFKDGSSLAVRIPDELVFGEDGQDVIIERQGDALVIRPAKPKAPDNLSNIDESYSSDFMSCGRNFRP